MRNLSAEYMTLLYLGGFLYPLVLEGARELSIIEELHVDYEEGYAGIRLKISYGVLSRSWALLA